MPKPFVSTSQGGYGSKPEKTEFTQTPLRKMREEAAGNAFRPREDDLSQEDPRETISRIAPSAMEAAEAAEDTGDTGYDTGGAALKEWQEENTVGDDTGDTGDTGGSVLDDLPTISDEEIDAGFERIMGRPMAEEDRERILGMYGHRLFTDPLLQRKALEEWPEEEDTGL
jgi:hypothetical protein